MTRRCSHCSNNGHNSRTCPTRGGVKLFGVRLTDGSIIKKSASMGNLSTLYNTSSSAAGSPIHDSQGSSEHPADGYLSDDTPHGSCSSNRRAERKKGVPWTEEEHKLFLLGLQKLGKGDWRGIARNYVVSRTPTQVASHAQKYFIRQSNASRRKRRSSLFDMVPEMALDTPTVPEEHVPVPSQIRDTDDGNPQPSLDLSLKPDFEPMETPEEPAQEQNQTEAGSNSFVPLVPGYFPAYLPIPFPAWQPNAAPPEGESGSVVPHQVLKPIPVLPKEPFNVDELVGMSHLSLGEPDNSRGEPSPLSLKLLGEPSRQSAFHVNAPISGSELSKGKGKEIRAV